MDTTTREATEEVSQSEAAKQYAAHLKQESWCVDLSLTPPRPLHARSGSHAAPETFRYGFPDWAKSKKVRVKTDDYAGFLDNLHKRLFPLLPRVTGSSFRPVLQRAFEYNGILRANTFVPFQPEVPQHFVMPEILEEYCSRFFMNDQDRKIVVQWLAHIIQRPTERPMWAVVLTGDQGTGKSSIFRIVTAALGGRHTWEKNSYADAFRQFSEVLPDNLLVCFDDARGNKSTYQDLKQAITRTSQPVEIKGVQKLVEREVFARVLICSNSPRPLVIEPGDRRLYVADPSRHKVDAEETAEFFVRFNKWLDEPGTPTILYAWLKSADLTDFNPGSTVKTETHALMVGLSASVLDTLLEDFVKDSPIFHEKTLRGYLSESGCDHIPPDLLKTSLAEFGYERARRPIDGKGKKRTIWVYQPAGMKRSRSLTAKEVEEIKRAEGIEF